MPSSTDCWGIEVGSAAIKAIRLKRSGSDVSVTDFDVIPFKKVLTSPDSDADEQVRVGLDQLIARHDLTKSTVLASVPGHMAFARFAKLPPVEPKKIPDIVKFEAVQQIPFSIEEVEWDYQTFQDEDSPEVEVGIFAITKDRLLPWLSNFQLIDLPLHGVALSPVAAFNALGYDLDLADKPDGTIIMDIGTAATDLIVTEAGRVWLRTIPIGGNHFTEALVKNFKLSFSKAEKLKREAATSKYARQIFTTMRPVFVDLVQEVQKSLGYYQSLNRDAELKQLIGLGQTFRLPGLQTFLKQQLQVEVTRLDEFQKIEVEGRDAAKFAESTLSLAPAYGLALQGLEMNRVDCNLLPVPIIREQVWKRKQPQFVAAAAIMTVAAGLAYGGLMMERGAYHSDDSEQARERVDQLLARAEQLRDAWDEAQSQRDPLQQTENILSLTEHRNLAGHVAALQEEILLSVGPQPAVLNGNPRAMAELPREQLRYLALTDVQIDYLPPLAAGGASPVGDGRGRGAREAGDGGQATSINPDEVDWANNPPAYRIRLSGFTPHGNAEVFLADRVMEFLNEAAADEQRPYRLRVDPQALSVRTVRDSDSDRRGTRTTTSQRGGGRGDNEQTTALTAPEPEAVFHEAQPGDSAFTLEFELRLEPPAGGAGDDAADENTSDADDDADPDSEADRE